jgi:hypothetical protein
MDSAGKLSGKNTAATVTEPMFGFCDDAAESEKTPKSKNLIRNISDDKVPQAEERGSAKSEQIDQFKQELEIEQLWKYELGFSQVIQHIAHSKKPVVGHNAKFDLAFLYHQFFKELPPTFKEFSDSLNKEFFSECWDTKVLSLYAGKLGKTDLGYLFGKCSKDKKYSNNLSFQPDENPNEPKKFSAYKDGG